MRRNPLPALILVLSACGGGSGATTSTAPSPATTSVTTTAPSTTVTTEPATTTTTLIEGPVDVVALVPFQLGISSFGQAGVGPVPNSGLTMALLAVGSGSTAPGIHGASFGTGQIAIIGVFGAAGGFPSDCLGFTLWAEDFTRLVDGFLPITPAGCGEVNASVYPPETVLLQTDRTIVVDLGMIPVQPFAPAFQVQNTAGDAGLYSIGQDQLVDPAALVQLQDGFLLPMGGDLLTVLGGAFTPIILPEPPRGPCEPSDTVLCLNNDRFRVQVSFTTTTGGLTGQTVMSPGSSVPLGPVEGGFWFLDEDRLEMIVKIVNGCGLNNRYWVFFTGLTDVDTTISLTITDTATDAPSTYDMSIPSPPVIDTEAFDTCP